LPLPAALPLPLDELPAARTIAPFSTCALLAAGTSLAPTISIAAWAEGDAEANWVGATIPATSNEP
jgi:hypothetical protein